MILLRRRWSRFLRPGLTRRRPYLSEAHPSRQESAVLPVTGPEMNEYNRKNLVLIKLVLQCWYLDIGFHGGFGGINPNKATI